MITPSRIPTRPNRGMAQADKPQDPPPDGGGKNGTPHPNPPVPIKPVVPPNGDPKK